jgi:hypothetical protein
MHQEDQRNGQQTERHETHLNPLGDNRQAGSRRGVAAALRVCGRAAAHFVIPLSTGWQQFKDEIQIALVDVVPHFPNLLQRFARRVGKFPIQRRSRLAA